MAPALPVVAAGERHAAVGRLDDVVARAAPILPPSGAPQTGEVVAVVAATVQAAEAPPLAVAAEATAMAEGRRLAPEPRPVAPHV